MSHCLVTHVGAVAALSVGLRVGLVVGLATGPAAGQMPGHPSVGEPREAPSIAGLHEPVPDSSSADPALPEGTLVIELRDADDGPLPRTRFTLGTVRQSIALGDKRERRELVTDDAGQVRLDGLSVESAIAYRVAATNGLGAFAALPFRLPNGAGYRVSLHVVPVTSDVEQALVAVQYVALVDVKDDRILVQQAIVAYNFGRTAWFANDVPMALPKGATALTSQQSMSDRTVTLDGTTAKLRGTFPPGESTIEYQWQVPFGETPSVELTIGLPPHVAVARAMAVASPANSLVVEGFSPAEVGTDQRGQRMLSTERSFRRGEAPLAAMTVRFGGIPTPGPARWVASGLALVVVLASVLWGLLARSRRGNSHGTSGPELEAIARQQAIELGVAHRSGEVGPTTFEAEKRRLIEDLAKGLSAT